MAEVSAPGITTIDANPANGDDTYDFAPPTIPKEDTTLPFFLDSPQYKLAEKSVPFEADKYDYVLEEGSPGRDRIESDMLTGNEGFLRAEASRYTTLKDRARREEALRDFVNRRSLDPTPISEQDVADFRDLIVNKDVPPDQVMEELYSRKTISDSQLDYTPEDEAGADPAAVSQTEQVVKNQIMKQQFALKKYQEVEAQVKSMSWGSYLAQGAEFIVPGLDWYRTQNLIPGKYDTPFLQGNNIQEQMRYLWSIDDPAEFKRVLGAAVDDLAAKNPLSAQSFAYYMLGATQDEYDLANLGSILELGSILPVGGAIRSLRGAILAPKLAAKGALATASKIKRTASLGAAALKAVGRNGFDKGAYIAATGNIFKAGFVTARDSLRNRLNLSSSEASVREFEQTVPDWINPELIVGGSLDNLSRELAVRLLSEDYRAKGALLDMLDNTVFVDRLSEARALDEAQTAASRIWNTQYPDLNDRLLAARHISSDETATNMHRMQFILGRQDMTLFDDVAEATQAVKDLELVGAEIIDINGRKAISLAKDVPETEESIRANLAFSTKSQAPNDFKNIFLKWKNLRAKALTSQEDLLDKQTLEDMKVAQAGSTHVLELLKHELKDISTLPQLKDKSRVRFDKFVQMQRTAKNPGSGTPGRFSRTLGEFEADWLKLHGSLPTEAETKAYFAYTRVSDFDWIVRNLGIYRDKARQGIENFSFKFRVNPPAQGVVPRAANDNFNEVLVSGVEGKTVSRIPWENRSIEDAGILVLDNNPATKFSIRKGGTNVQANYFRMRNTSEEAFNKAIGKGWKMVQLTRYGEDALRKTDGLTLPEGRIHFLLVRDHRASPLSLKQVPLQPGGHIQYPVGGFYVKQPTVRMSKSGRYGTYYGDKTMYQFDDEKMAGLALGHMEQARKMLLDVEAGRMAESDLKLFLKKNTPLSLGRFKALFSKAGFSKDESFYLVKHGENTFDAHKLADRYGGVVTKDSDSIYNLYKGVDIEYAQARDMPMVSWVNNGTQDNPAYALTRAKMLDPITTMSRAASAVMRSRYLDDVKFKSAEKFVSLFSSVMKTPLKELQANPIKYLLEPEWQEGLKGDARLTLNAAKNYRAAARDFLSVQSDAERDLSWLQAKILKGNPGPMTNWAYATASDPASFARSVAFNAKLGLFNPTQFLKQLNTLAHVTALEPGHAMQGTMSTALQRGMFLNTNKAVTDHMAQYAKTLGWNVDDFKKASEFLRNSGWWKVGREVSGLDDFKNTTSVITTRMGRFLDAGRIFFRGGDRVTRMASFNTAFLKWRAENPKAVFNNTVGRELLARADLMTMNMTSVSNSAIQHGWAGMVTQFWGYQMRLGQQMWSGGLSNTGRLTRAEKARVLLTYSALYGVPVTAGAVTVAWPVHETIKEQALANGWDLDDNAVTRIINEGMINPILEELSGTRWNFGETMGPAGVSVLEDIIDGDKDSLEVAMGASGSTFHDAWMAVDPLLMLITDAFQGENDTYHITGYHWLDLLRTVTTARQVERLYYAMGAMKYMARSGETIDNVTGLEGVITALTGLTPERIVDTFIKMDNEKDRNRFQRAQERAAVTWMRRGYEALANKDRETAIKYFTNANAHVALGELDKDPANLMRVMRKSFDKYENLLVKASSELANDSPEQLQRWKELADRRKKELGITDGR